MTTSTQSNDVEAVIDQLEKGDRVHIDIEAAVTGDPDEDEPLIVPTGDRLLADTGTVIDDEPRIQFDEDVLVDDGHWTDIIGLNGDWVIARWPRDVDGWRPIDYPVGFVDDLEIIHEEE